MRSIIYSKRNISWRLCVSVYKGIYVDQILLLGKLWNLSVYKDIMKEQCSWRWSSKTCNSHRAKIFTIPGGGRKQVLRLSQCTNMQKIMVYDLVRKRTRWPTDDNFNLRGAKYKQQCYSRAQKKHRYFKGFIIFSYQLSTNYNHTVSSNNKGHRHSMKPGCKNDTINNNHTKPAFVSGKSLEYFQFEFSWYCAHAFTRDAIARTPEE